MCEQNGRSTLDRHSVEEGRIVRTAAEKLLHRDKLCHMIPMRAVSSDLMGCATRIHRT